MTYSESRSYSVGRIIGRVIACLVLALIVPPILTASALHLAEAVGDPAAGQLWLAGVFFPPIIGVVGIYRLPMQDWIKAVVTVIYLPTAIGSLIMFALYYVCSAFTKCL